MERINWKKYLISSAVLFAAFILLFLANQWNAKAAEEDYQPEHGIPLMIIRIDESDEAIQAAKEKDPDHKYGNIRQMRNSSDHSVRCVGTTELKVPEGYTGGYSPGTYPLTTGELPLEYIRGRGNGSWFGAKKPYKIKLDKKQDLLGMGKSKEWALLAERADPTLMKNRITYKMGEEMGLSYTPQLVPIEVVMIGSVSGAEYLGVFNLVETIKLEKSRIDLDEPDKNATEEEGEKNITGSYIVSFYNAIRDNKEPESNRFFTKKQKGLFGFLNKEPEYTTEDLTEPRKKQREYIRKYISDTEDLIMSYDHIDHDLHRKIDEKMDLQSTADYWLIQVFSRNTDAFYTSSTYLYKEANGKLYWGPLWDFDYAYGREPVFTNALFTEGFGELSSSPWITHLRNCDPEFVQLLKERWHVLDEKLAAMTAKGGTLDQYRDEVAQAQAADYKKWSAYPGLTFYYAVEDYTGIVENLRSFIEKRRAWFNANLDSIGCFRTVSFDGGGGEGSMADIIDLKPCSKFTLPDCGFIPAPDSCLAFDCWQIDGCRYQQGKTVVINKDTVVRAVWKPAHTWNEGVVTKTPTCVETGEKTYSCINCTETMKEALPTVAHKYKKTTTPATLSKNGEITEACEVCKDVKAKTVIYRPKTCKLEKTEFTYNGSAKTPAVKVTDTKGNVIPDSDYTLKYSNNKNVGTATVIVRFKGNYSGELSLNFKIVPKAAALSKVTPGAKSFTASWKKQTTQTTGYQIQYSTDKTFASGSKTVSIKDNKTVSQTIRNLKSGKTYYVRIRTYKTADGKNYYSKWSAEKSVKVK